MGSVSPCILTFWVVCALAIYSGFVISQFFHYSFCGCTKCQLKVLWFHNFLSLDTWNTCDPTKFYIDFLWTHKKLMFFCDSQSVNLIDVNFFPILRCPYTFQRHSRRWETRTWELQDLSWRTWELRPFWDGAERNNTLGQRSRMMAVSLPGQRKALPCNRLYGTGSCPVQFHLVDVSFNNVAFCCEAFCHGCQIGACLCDCSQLPKAFSLFRLLCHVAARRIWTQLANAFSQHLHLGVAELMITWQWQVNSKLSLCDTCACTSRPLHLNERYAERWGWLQRVRDTSHYCPSEPPLSPYTLTTLWNACGAGMSLAVITVVVCLSRGLSTESSIDILLDFRRLSKSKNITLFC